MRQLRKITSMVGAHGPATGANLAQAYALCDDGTVWRMEVNTVYGKVEWHQVDVSEVETKAIGR